MENEQKKECEVEIIPIKSVGRIQRWHVCQQIGKVYYDSVASDEHLILLLEHLRKYGIAE